MRHTQGERCGGRLKGTHSGSGVGHTQGLKGVRNPKNTECASDLSFSLHLPPPLPPPFPPPPPPSFPSSTKTIGVCGREVLCLGPPLGNKTSRHLSPPSLTPPHLLQVFVAERRFDFATDELTVARFAPNRGSNGCQVGRLGFRVLEL